MDSIVKNHASPYASLFHRRLVANFAHVFAAVLDVKTRTALYKLRSTWNEVFPPATLYQLDLKIKGEHDPKWPAAPPKATAGSAAASAGSNIHINPAVFKNAKKVPGVVRQFSLLCFV